MFADQTRVPVHNLRPHPAMTKEASDNKFIGHSEPYACPWDFVFWRPSLYFVSDSWQPFLLSQPCHQNTLRWINIWKKTFLHTKQLLFKGLGWVNLRKKRLTILLTDGFCQFDTIWGSPGKREPQLRQRPPSNWYRPVCGHFSWLIIGVGGPIHWGQCQPWEGGPGLNKAAG